MSLFGDLDIASAKDNPYNVPNGTYTCFVVDVQVGPTRDGSKSGLKLFYRVDEGAYEGRKLQEWKEIPKKEDLISSDPQTREKANNALAYLKDRLLSLGVPVDRLNNLQPTDLVGRKCKVILTTNSNGFPQVSRVMAESPAPTTGSTTVTPTVVQGSDGVKRFT